MDGEITMYVLALKQCDSCGAGMLVVGPFSTKEEAEDWNKEHENKLPYSTCGHIAVLEVFSPSQKIFESTDESGEFGIW